MNVSRMRCKRDQGRSCILFSPLIAIYSLILVLLHVHIDMQQQLSLGQSIADGRGPLRRAHNKCTFDEHGKLHVNSIAHPGVPHSSDECMFGYLIVVQPSCICYALHKIVHTASVRLVIRISRDFNWDLPCTVIGSSSQNWSPICKHVFCQCSNIYNARLPWYNERSIRSFVEFCVNSMYFDAREKPYFWYQK